MTKHTPGTWRLEKWTYEDGKRTVLTIQNEVDAIAQVLDLWCPDERAEEAAANARLLVAAPKLLAALEWQAAYCAKQAALSSEEIALWARAENMARAAIAEAKAEAPD